MDPEYLDEGAQFRSSADVISFANAYVCKRFDVSKKYIDMGLIRYMKLGVSHTNSHLSCYINLPSVVALASKASRVEYMKSVLSRNGYVEV